MYGQLFRALIVAGGAALAYFAADKGTKHLTGKHIHEHAMDCLPVEFKNKIQTWCGRAAESVEVHLRLLADDGSVHGKRTLRALGLATGLWKKPDQIPVIITEEVITLEQARLLGFDLSATTDQEVEYMVA